MRILGILVLSLVLSKNGAYLYKKLWYVTSVLARLVQIRVPMHTNIDEF